MQFKSFLFVLFKVVFFALIALLPFWASGLSVQRFLLHAGIFSIILYFEESMKSSMLRVAFAVTATAAYGIALVNIERSSLASLSIRIIIILWLVGFAVVFGRWQLRRLIFINLVVLLMLLVVVEIGFRFVTDAQLSSQYQIIELYRYSRNDGPGGPPVSSGTFTNGLRTTTDQPLNPLGRVLIFGGSTTQSGEVVDSETFPSQLQRMLNNKGARMRVENYGLSSRTATDRAKVLGGIEDLGERDIVVFYIGINEASVAFTQRDTPAGIIRKVPELGTAIQKASSYSRIADVLFRGLVFGAISISEKSKDVAVIEFRNALQSANKIALDSGANFVPILQANMYTRDPLSVYDKGLAAQYSPRLSEIMAEMYTRMLPEITKYKNHGDARAVMNSLAKSPYFDWMHVDSFGDRAIASYVFELLADKGLLK